jgi:hypothetical protein
VMHRDATANHSTRPPSFPSQAGCLHHTGTTQEPLHPAAFPPPGRQDACTTQDHLATSPSGPCHALRARACVLRR